MTNEDGSELPPSWVGLRKNNERVRALLSPAFRNYLDGREEWFSYMERFRHALAHRIPPYVPPHMVTYANADAYQNLEQRMTAATLAGDMDEHDRLAAEQSALTFFRPYLSNWNGGKPETVAFHPQMLADFHTLEELCWKALEEFDSTR